MKQAITNVILKAVDTLDDLEERFDQRNKDPQWPPHSIMCECKRCNRRAHNQYLKTEWKKPKATSKRRMAKAGK